MGQYYKPTSIDKEEHVESWDYDNGSKLMEHSYIGNNFMSVVEKLLQPEGKWYKTRIVWCGDYADPEVNKGEENLYSIIDKKIKPKETKHDPKYRFLVNHSKKEFLDLKEYAKWTCEVCKQKRDYPIHPLSLLTAEGNGRGGGDYHDEAMDHEHVGEWSRDIISLELEAAGDQVHYQFCEHR